MFRGIGFRFWLDLEFEFTTLDLQTVTGPDSHEVFLGYDRVMKVMFWRGNFNKTMV